MALLELASPDIQEHFGRVLSAENPELALA
jgi:hypothetical protein